MKTSRIVEPDSFIKNADIDVFIKKPFCIRKEYLITAKKKGN